jgi:putative aldouronate transport system substrate-binding protein
LQIGVPALNEYGETLRKIREEAYISIIVGDKPIEYFDEAILKYNEAGGALVLEQANEWFKKNRNQGK